VAVEDGRALDDIVTLLCARHPRFPRSTVERLVARTAEELTGAPPWAFTVLVRRVARNRLDYADSLDAAAPARASG
jgi:hypothetical protein